MLRSQPKRQRLQAASLLASLSPQRGEGLRVRGGHIQNRLPFLLVSAPSGVPAEHLTLLRNTLCKCLILQHVTFAAKAPKMPVASPLASLSPQRGEGLRVRGGHIQSRLPREPPVVDEVALRLRLPAEQALCGVASPGACA